MFNKLYKMSIHSGELIIQSFTSSPFLSPFSPNKLVCAAGATYEPKHGLNPRQPIWFWNDAWNEVYEDLGQDMLVLHRSLNYPYIHAFRGNVLQIIASQ